MELSIDTASEMTSVALSAEGQLVAEATWRCRRNHSVELLPAIERLFVQAKAEKNDVNAVFVCTGPGGYTGLRVGMSVAKGLAYPRGLPMVGIGRLELDAYPHAASAGPIVAVHRAGRGELAWAVYRADPWRELLAPRLSKPDELAASVEDEALIVGETDETLRRLVEERSESAKFASPAASVRRAATLAALGYDRLSRGETDEPALIAPVYLRPPAIGPQTAAGA
jgi:tRNA threonylcarbamoyladenosine biosynthesis protein TsaB